MENLAVIKYGGHAMEHEDLARAFATDLAWSIEHGRKCVLVHGGGPQISTMLKKLSIESCFVRGLRKTDAATMQVVKMVLAGEVNTDVVTKLQSEGIRTCGISGCDGGLFHCVPKDPELGYVGEITHVDPEILHALLNANFLPCIAPIALGPQNLPYNINADTAAGAVAGKLQAEYFVLLSDVQGVLDQDGQLIHGLTASKIQDLIAQNVIREGMIPKVESCLYALRCGAKKALILDGRARSSLRRFLEHNEPLGTIVTKE